MDYMSKYNLTGLPIVENKNKYYGYVSLKELAREIVNGDYHKINTSYGNLLNVLRGNKVLKYDKEISGRVLAATFGKETFLKQGKEVRHHESRCSAGFFLSFPA